MSIRLSLLALVAASTLACAPTVGADGEAPPRTVDTGPLPKVVSGIVADDQNVFWWGESVGATSKRYVIAQRPAEGGSVTVLADVTNTVTDPFTQGDGAAVYGVWINHTEVFWLRQGAPRGYEIDACPIGGGETRTIADHVETFVVDDERAYAIVDGRREIVAVALDTGARRTLARGAFDRIALADTDALLVDDDGLLERVARDGSSVEDLVQMKGLDVAGTAAGAIIASFGSPASYCDDGDGVDCFDLLVADARFAHPRTIGHQMGFALDDAAVYAITDDHHVTRTPVAGGAASSITAATSFTSEITVNRALVFWTGSNLGDPTSPTFIQQAAIR